MFGSNKFMRYFVFATLILAGASFIALMMANFEVETETFITELLAVVILIVVIMGAAMLTALGIRAFKNRRERSTGDDEEED